MFDPIHHQQTTRILLQQHNKNQPLETLFSKKHPTPKLSLPHQNLFHNNSNQLITVPIKEYSNKFLREKKKEEQDSSSKKKDPFPNSHLYHNRKLISEFKKYKGKSQKFRNSSNKENGDFIIYNLLFDKNQRPGDLQRKTIFGTFTQNFVDNPKIANQESTLFENGWKTTKNGALFQVKREVYQKICEKQKSIIPEHRKKCKTLAESSHCESLENDKKLQKISTSRALEKYSKIIKVNPEHGKIQKMKIKKELAKSLRFESCERSEIETKQITLAKKQVSHKMKNMFMHGESSKSSILKLKESQGNLNEENKSSTRTPDKIRDKPQKDNFISSKVGIFSSGIKFKRLRKFSHQVESTNKKCITEQKQNDTFEDFQINGWDINF